MLPSLSLFNSEQLVKNDNSKTSDFSLFGYFGSSDSLSNNNNNSSSTQNTYGATYPATKSGNNERVTVSKQDSTGSVQGGSDRYSTPDEYDPEEPGRFLDRLTSTHPEEVVPYENGFDSSTSPSPTMSGQSIFTHPSDPGMPPISAKLTREDLNGSYIKPQSEDKSMFMKTLESSPLGFFFKSDDGNSKQPASSKVNYGQHLNLPQHAPYQSAETREEKNTHRTNATLPSTKPPSYESVQKDRTSQLKEESLTSLNGYRINENPRNESIHNSYNELNVSGAKNVAGQNGLDRHYNGNNYTPNQNGFLHEDSRRYMPRQTDNMYGTSSHQYDGTYLSGQNEAMPNKYDRLYPQQKKAFNGHSQPLNSDHKHVTSRSRNFQKMHSDMFPTIHETKTQEAFTYPIPAPRSVVEVEKQNGLTGGRKNLPSRPAEEIKQPRPMNTSFYELSSQGTRSSVRRRSSDIDTRHLPTQSAHWSFTGKPKKSTQFSYLGKDLPEPKTVLGSRENLKKFARGAKAKQPKRPQEKKENTHQKKQDDDSFSFFGIFGGTDDQTKTKDDSSFMGYFKSFQETAEKELEDSTLLTNIFGKRSTAKPSMLNSVAVSYHRGILFFGPLYGKVPLNAFRCAARLYCKKIDVGKPRDGQEARTFAEMNSPSYKSRNRSSEFFDKLDSLAEPLVSDQNSKHQTFQSSRKDSKDSQPDISSPKKMAEPSRLAPYPVEPDMASISPDISEQLDYSFVDNFSSAPYFNRKTDSLSSSHFEPNSETVTNETGDNGTGANETGAFDPQHPASIFSLIELFNNLEEYEQPVKDEQLTQDAAQLNDTERNDNSKASSYDLDHYKRVFARQRAKDIADHAQKLLAKDKEISDLRQVVDKLQNFTREPDPNVRNSKMYSEKAELERIICQHAKEQLRLQRCLAINSAHDPSSNTIGYQALEETNKALRKELNGLEQSNVQTQLLEDEVTQQKIECETLQKQFDVEHQRSQVLTSELQNALIQNTELTHQNTRLQERLTHLETFEEECRKLNGVLKQQQDLYETSIFERNELKQTVEKLEDQVKLMQAAAEKRKQLEKEHEEAIASLQFKQDEIRNLQKEQQQSKREHHDSVSKLEDKVRQLEKRYEEQSINVGKLTQELQTLRKVTNKTMEEIAVQTQEKQYSKSSDASSKVFTDKSDSETASLELMSSCQSIDAGLKGLEAQYYEALLKITSDDDGLIHSLSNGLSAQAVRSEKSENLLQISSSSSAMSNEVFQNLEDLSKSGSLLSDNRARRTGSRKTESDDVDVKMLQRLQSASINKLAVFIARYNYTPSSDSPNENPDSELPLKAGEYIYVYGDADEDGFYEGELMSGERGLVPGNFIERIADGAVPMLVNTNHSQGSEDDLNSQLRDLDFNSSEEDAVNKVKPNQYDAHARSDHHGGSDLEDIIEVDEEDNDNSLFSISEIGNEYNMNGIPPPSNLTLERQFPTNVIITWSHPHNCPLSSREYKIYVNGVPKSTVQGKVKTMLLDYIDQDLTYRISVCTLTADGMSDEAACTMMVGKGASASPTRLKASHVTPDTADITWLPGNSNYSHIISVHGREMVTVKPGRHQYSFAGLSPSSVYRVTVTAKPRHTTNDNSKRFSTEIEFKTLPGGLPEPPLDVQIKPGGRPGTLIVEWLPVTITTSGLSNGAVVMGYAVYANDLKIASIDSPTADRLVLSIDKLAGVPHIVVRTLSPNGFSSDSALVHIPQHLLRSSANKQSEINKVRSNMYDSVSDDDSQSSRTTTSEDSHPEVFAVNGAVKMAANQLPKTNDVKRKEPIEYQSESDRSELSDIAEEAEEELSDFESADLPGFSDSINKSLRDEQFKNVKDTLDNNAKVESEFDETDPEVEQLNKPNHAVPIQIIRQQRDYERESDLSPHNQVLEPVPVKPKQAEVSVPHIEITKESDGITSCITEQYSEHDPHNGSIPVAKPSMRENTRPRKHSLDSGSDWEDSRKDYDNKKNHTLEKSQKSSQDTSSTDPEELYDDSTVRFFVALYDYDPASMSPNDDGVEEELGFREGDIIKVLGDKDADGFYFGELNGKQGFVPYNMVKEAQGKPIPEPHRNHMVSERNNVPQNQNSQHDANPNNSRGRINSTEAPNRTGPNGTPTGYQTAVNGHSSSISQKEVERCMVMRAIFDYDPSVLSPNPDIENELTFQQGDFITVYGEMDEDGFFMGELNGERGLVPSNFLEEASDPGLNGSAGSPAPSTGGYSLNSFDRSPTTKDSLQDLGRQSSIGSTVSKQSNGLDQVSPTSIDDSKKKKGLLSKGKAFLKKFGGGESGKQKKK
ncbi:uncharacterized protein [Antedon mediterranea]|uniref:uncharacterized protein isoform X3 n=1 Tax=Antedon mediterranea TaxID=105859 RepID=UPI003AF42C74